MLLNNTSSARSFLMNSEIYKLLFNKSYNSVFSIRDSKVYKVSKILLLRVQSGMTYCNAENIPQVPLARERMVDDVEMGSISGLGLQLFGDCLLGHAEGFYIDNAAYCTLNTSGTVFLSLVPLPFPYPCFGLRLRLMEDFQRLP